MKRLLVLTFLICFFFSSVSVANQNTNFDWIPQKADKPKHFRKGDIGDWKNYFSAEQSQQMDNLFLEKMKDSGLQFDFGDGIILP